MKPKTPPPLPPVSEGNPTAPEAGMLQDEFIRLRLYVGAFGFKTWDLLGIVEATLAVSSDLKSGQSEPERLKHHADQIRKVVEEAEGGANRFRRVAILGKALSAHFDALANTKIQES